MDVQPAFTAGIWYSNLSTTPRSDREEIKAAVGIPLPWAASPLGVFPKPPSLRDPAFLRGCDWTEVSLQSIRVIALDRCHLPLQPYRYSLSTKQVMARWLNMLSRIAKVPCSCVFGFQVSFRTCPISPFTYRPRERQKVRKKLRILKFFDCDAALFSNQPNDIPPTSRIIFRQSSEQYSANLPNSMVFSLKVCIL